MTNGEEPFSAYDTRFYTKRFKKQHYVPYPSATPIFYDMVLGFVAGINLLITINLGIL